MSKANPTQAVTDALVAAAFVECCRELLARLCQPTALKGVVESIRSKALFHVVRRLSSGGQVAGETEGFQAAINRINSLCDGWAWGPLGLRAAGSA